MAAQSRSMAILARLIERYEAMANDEQRLKVRGLMVKWP